MTWLNTGADVGTMVTGASAATAAYVWARNQIEARRERKALREYRYWNAFITLEGILTGYVRIIQEPSDPPERVTFDVINPDGSTNPQMAYGIRQAIESDGMVSRSPSPAQMDFLKDLRGNRWNRSGGYPIN